MRVRPVLAAVAAPACTPVPASVLDNGPAWLGWPWFRPLTARPQAALHGSGGGGGCGGGHGHGGNPGILVSGSAGYGTPGGGGKGGGWLALIIVFGPFAVATACADLGKAHQYTALLVLVAVLIGVPLAGFGLLLLRAQCLPRFKRSPRDH
jgi:hypothetical protein